MQAPSRNLVLIMLAILLLSIPCDLWANREQDSLALVAFYNSTNGSGWTDNDGWLTATLENWEGVTITDDRVSGLYLHSKNLSGTLPPEIGNLTELEVLSLSSNDIGGSIPDTLGNLDMLKTLNLGYNEFTGVVPVGIGRCSSLEYLKLSMNELTGGLPGSFENLIHLKTLELADNLFTGSLPEVMGSLDSLETLHLEYTWSETLPDTLRNLTNLKEFVVGGSFTGSIPDWIGNLVSLEDLVITGGSFTGPIPASMGDLINLQTLDMSWNLLGGSLPLSMGNLTSLTSLKIINCFLSGELPDTLANLANLEILWITNNAISGGIPGRWGELSELRELNLANMELTDPLPPGLGDLANLNLLGLAYNNISGGVPAEFNGMTSLGTFYLNDNQIEDLPDLSGLPILSAFWTEDNRLTFEDLEPNVSIGGNFHYSPQANIGVARDTTIMEGQTFTLTISTPGEHNEYRWKHNGAYITAASSDPTEIIEAVDDFDSGVYTCEVTNTIATQLTLVSEPITLTVTDFVEPPIDPADSLALVELYHELGGDSWTNSTGWPGSGGRPSDWFGVTIEMGRVIELSLPDNNLIGILPGSLAELDQLQLLDLSQNHIAGSVPESWTDLLLLDSLLLNDNQLTALPDSLDQLSALSVLHVQDNHLDFGSIEPNMGINSEFLYSPQDSVGARVDTAVRLEESLQMSVAVGGTANLYDWRHNGASISGPSTSPDFTIASMTADSVGEYDCIITNTIVPDLTLVSRPFIVTVNTVGVDPSTGELPKDYLLIPAFPNPFNPSTTIRYGLPRDSHVALTIYDALGHAIITLVNDYQPAGWYTLNWAGTNDSGRSVSTGVYLARIQAGSYTEVIKMVYLR
jgi:Leucine-rich repeat (LRR) protein